MSLPLDVEAIRSQFPALHQEIHGKKLAYLDNAATTQKPQVVIDAMRHYYEHDNSNVHRGVHALSERATRDYEAAREAVRSFVGAPSTRGVVFTRGTTEAINLVAQAWGRANIGPGDDVVVTGLEHHSNIVPWQLLAQETGANLRVVPVLDDGSLDQDAYADLLGPTTKLVAVGHVSNALGTLNPVQAMTKQAHDVGAVVLVDGAQAVPHVPVDFQAIGCDFYAMSAHKMYGPTGIGALIGREEVLERMPPWQGGGDMITRVTFEGTTYNELPFKFEAGTPNISGAIGFGAACKWLADIGVDNVARHEHELLQQATDALEALPGVRILGTAPGKAAVVSFTMGEIHPHDIGTLLDHEGIAIRAGHHCAQPVMDRFGVPATARASFGVYNTPEEVERLAAAVQMVQGVFA